MHGFDADPAQLVLAREAGPPGSRFEEADARDVPQRDEFYDRVVCQALLVHHSRPEEVIREMARLTRVGGLVAAIEPVLPSSSVNPASSPSLDTRLARSFALAGKGALEAGLGCWSIARLLPRLFADAGLDFICTSSHTGVLAVGVNSRGTPQQRLLRALTKPMEERAEQELQDALAGVGDDEQRVLAAYRERVREARRAGLRTDSWWEWRQHPLVVCVGRKVAV